jgi:hypothetical protein
MAVVHKAKLFRLENTEDGVFGVFTLNDRIVSYTMESFDKRIPSGTYRCEPDNTGRHRWFKLLDVSDRTNIEIHIANYEDQLEGCIALGTYIGTLRGKRALLRSRDSMELLRSLVGDNIFDLEIVNA